MDSAEFAQFMQFLREDLAIPATYLQVALLRAEQTPSLLPMVLWQYGFVSLAQLNRMFDWLEHSISS